MSQVGLAVVVSVDVDEARGDQHALGVDLLGARSRDLADGGDAAVLDAYVGGEAFAARSVHDGPAAHDQIVSPFHNAVLACADLSLVSEARVRSHTAYSKTPALFRWSASMTLGEAAFSSPAQRGRGITKWWRGRAG